MTKGKKRGREEDVSEGGVDKKAKGGEGGDVIMLE